ncbi:hypothetical protein [Clostridium tepidiprofundi]|nr:hypothetical protein [Clostridium tepidiprofundi]
MFGGEKVFEDKTIEELNEAIRWPKIKEETIEKCIMKVKGGRYLT